jgi:hypothetical protein
MVDSDNMTVFAMQFSRTKVLLTGPYVDMRRYARCSSELGPGELAEWMEVYALYAPRNEADE